MVSGPRMVLPCLGLLLGSDKDDPKGSHPSIIFVIMSEQWPLWVSEGWLCV